MGIGDDMMWRAEAYHQFKKTGKKQRPFNLDRQAKSVARGFAKPVWHNTPWLDFNYGEPFETHTNNNKRWYHNNTPYKPKTAPIEFKDSEEMWFMLNYKKLQPYILINPDAKQSVFANNKKYFRWQEVIDGLQDYKLIRALPSPKFIAKAKGQTDYLGLQNVRCLTIREAMILIKYAQLVVTTEGGVHHIAGNLDVPCVVLYGSHQSPQRTGYEGQINITRKTHCNPDGLGCHISKGPCTYCEQAMDSIEPKEVIELVKQNYNKRDYK
jgi:ADP-heptose:LPS heptosyltransferase